MSTITRLYLTTGGSATTTGNAGAAGPTSAITSSQSAPIAAAYLLADSTVMTDVGLGASGTAPFVSNVTFCLRVVTMDSNATGRIVLWEVSAAASGSAPAAVTSAVPVHVEHFEGGFGLQPYPTNADGTETCAGAASGAGGGPQGGNQDYVIRVPWYDIPDARFGAGTSGGSNSAWYAVQFLSKNGTTLTNGIKFEAWLEY
jgi:hypothetical protein